MPELRHLSVFAAVARERNFTRAAEQLHLAQQAVSKSVAQLERELGVELLERTSREVRPTPAGEALLADAAFARARDLGRGLAGALAVGVTAAVGPGILDPALATLRRDAPGLSIAVREIRPREAAPMLAERRLGVVIARSMRPQLGIEVVKLPPTPAALVVPEGHRLAGRDAVGLAEIDGERLLTWSPPGSPYTDLLVERCRRAGAAVTPVESAVTGGSGLVELTALDSVALVPAPAPPAPGTVRIALPPDVTLPLVALRPAGAASPPAARLIDALRGRSGVGY